MTKFCSRVFARLSKLDLVGGIAIGVRGTAILAVEKVTIKAPGSVGLSKSPRPRKGVGKWVLRLSGDQSRISREDRHSGDQSRISREGRHPKELSGKELPLSEAWWPTNDQAGSWRPSP